MGVQSGMMRLQCRWRQHVPMHDLPGHDKYLILIPKQWVEAWRTCVCVYVCVSIHPHQLSGDRCHDKKWVSKILWDSNFKNNFWFMRSLSVSLGSWSIFRGPDWTVISVWALCSDKLFSLQDGAVSMRSIDEEIVMEIIWRDVHQNVISGLWHLSGTFSFLFWYTICFASVGDLFFKSSLKIRLRVGECQSPIQVSRLVGPFCLETE